MRRRRDTWPPWYVMFKTPLPARNPRSKNRIHRCRRVHSCLLLASTQSLGCGESVESCGEALISQEGFPALTRVREGPSRNRTRVSRRSSSTRSGPLRLRRSSCRAGSVYDSACTLQEAFGQMHLKVTFTAEFFAANCRSSARRRAASRFARAGDFSTPPREPPVVPLCTR
jgi:hypothetical protein